MIDRNHEITGDAQKSEVPPIKIEEIVNKKEENKEQENKQDE